MTLSATVALARGGFRLDVTIAADKNGLVLIGPNGAGKTTLLHALLGVRRPDDGRITLDAATLFDRSARIDLPPEERRIGYVPQEYALFPHMDAAANVAFAMEGATNPPPHRARRERAVATLEAMGLSALAGRRPSALSGGERQRVAVARAIVAEPRALLLDEPLAALDAGTRVDIRIFLRERLRALRCPFVMVTHDPADAAALDARVAVLEGGRVVQQGSLSDLRRAPATPFVARFLGGD